jgi:hypothetical protein
MNDVLVIGSHPVLAVFLDDRAKAAQIERPTPSMVRTPARDSTEPSPLESRSLQFMTTES